ncbi:MAG: ATP-binding protein [Myxococcota bacterium]
MTEPLSPRTAFIGRRTELKQILELIKKHRLLTVVGTPGVGKTRIIRELCDGPLAHEFPGSVVWCNLSDAADFNELIDFIAAALGSKISPKADRQAGVLRIGAVLKKLGPMILVCDNFEHLAQHAVHTLPYWMSVAPNARFIVTSRGDYLSVTKLYSNSHL